MSDLGRTAEELTREVGELRRAVERFGPRVERAERVSVRTAVATAVLLVVVLVVGLIGYRVYVTEARIDSLCPVLALILGGADATSRPSGDARDRYLETINTMTWTYERLGCTAPLVPPRQEVQR